MQTHLHQKNAQSPVCKQCNYQHPIMEQQHYNIPLGYDCYSVWTIAILWSDMVPNNLMAHEFWTIPNMET